MSSFKAWTVPSGKGLYDVINNCLKDKLMEDGVLHLVCDFVEWFIRRSGQRVNFVHWDRTVLKRSNFQEIASDTQLQGDSKIDVGDIIYTLDGFRHHTSLAVTVANECLSDRELKSICGDSSCYGDVPANVSRYIEHPPSFYALSTGTATATGSNYLDDFRNVEFDINVHQLMLRSASGGRAVPPNKHCYWNAHSGTIFIKGPWSTDNPDGLFQHRTLPLDWNTPDIYLDPVYSDSATPIAYPDPITEENRKENKRKSLDRLIKLFPGARLYSTDGYVRFIRSDLSKHGEIVQIVTTPDDVPDEQFTLFFTPQIRATKGPHGNIPSWVQVNKPTNILLLHVYV